MGGHSAWKKRLAEGKLAKEGTGGAIARHRPRFGRMGIVRPHKKGSNNPKRQGGGRTGATASPSSSEPNAASNNDNNNEAAVAAKSAQMERAKQILYKWGFVAISGLLYLLLKKFFTPNYDEEKFPEL